MPVPHLHALAHAFTVPRVVRAIAKLLSALAELLDTATVLHDLAQPVLDWLHHLLSGLPC